MRRLILGLMVAGFAPAAYAADYGDILRGSEEYDPRPNYETYVPGHPNYFSWGGGYIGAQVGYGTASMDFSEATQSLVAFMLRELALEQEAAPSQWQVLGKDSTRSVVFGAFVGYNVQWENAVLGVELNYNRTDYSGTAPVSPISRVTSAGGNTYAVTVTGAASLDLTDIATFRGRVGWANGFYMPYFTAGFAVARGDVTRSATVSGTENAGGVITPFSFTSTEVNDNAWMYGWAAGAGVDFALTPNSFLRAEYEYIALRIDSIEATAQHNSHRCRLPLLTNGQRAKLSKRRHLTPLFLCLR